MYHLQDSFNEGRYQDKIKKGKLILGVDIADQ